MLLYLARRAVGGPAFGIFNLRCEQHNLRMLYLARRAVGAPAFATPGPGPGSPRDARPPCVRAVGGGVLGVRPDGSGRSTTASPRGSAGRVVGFYLVDPTSSDRPAAKTTRKPSHDKREIQTHGRKNTSTQNLRQGRPPTFPGHLGSISGRMSAPPPPAAAETAPEATAEQPDVPPEAPDVSPAASGPAATTPAAAASC